MDELSRPQSVLPIQELAAQITELAGHLNAANHRWLTLIAEFDRRGGWSDGATQSCAHWLNWQCGLDMGAAREKVRVAHALEKLPKISAAMERGELSYSKVRALTRVASESDEDYLLSIALHGTAHHVETLVRYYRRAQEAQELSREARQQANRELRFSYDDYDGSLILRGRLPAEAGALLVKALSAITDASFKADFADKTPPQNVSAETREERPNVVARRVDALVQIAESFLKHGAEALSGGDRHQIVVHVDVETLKSSVAGRCELEEGPSIAAETARRLACDSNIVSIVENEKGEPLDVGRKTRSIPTALRRALNARDKGCRFPGCTNTKYVDAHHIHHWAHGGETKASNLVTLCRFHHRKVHEGGVSIQILDDGAFRFVRPNGTVLDSSPSGCTIKPTDWTQLPALHHEQGIKIDKNTATTRWRGEQLDYGMAIESMLIIKRRAGGVSAETEESMTGIQKVKLGVHAVYLDPIIDELSRAGSN